MYIGGFRTRLNKCNRPEAVCFLLGKFNLHRNYFTKRLKINGDSDNGLTGLSIRLQLTHFNIIDRLVEEEFQASQRVGTRLARYINRAIKRID